MKRFGLSLVALTLTSCSTTERTSAPLLGAPPLCSAGVRLGDVQVAPLTHWRPDQKEKEARAEIARKAIEAAFRSTPCAQSVKVLPAAPDTEAAAKIAQAKSEGAETAVLITVHELGPILNLSIPVLWSTWSDVKFDLEAVDAATGEAKFRVEHHRKVGGAFQLRGVGPLQGEMETALHEVITGAPAK